MKTRTLLIVLLGLSSLLQAQNPEAFLRMDTAQACAGEIISIPVKISGVNELGVSSFGLIFELKNEDTAYYEPVLTTWDSVNTMGQPLITNLNDSLLKGILIYNYTQKVDENYRLSRIYVTFVQASGIPNIRFQENEIMFNLNFRLKKQISKPINIAFKTSFGSHISWNVSSNYTLVYQDSGQIQSRPIPEVHAGPRHQSLTSEHDISMCAGQSVRLEAAGGVKYEWLLYPTKSNHLGYLADSNSLPIPVERVIANPHIPDPILIPYMPSNVHLLLKVTDEYGCVAYDSLYIFAQRHTVKIAPKKDTLIDKGETVQLSVQVLSDSSDIVFKPYSYHWYPADKLISDNVIDPYTMPLDNPTVFWVNVSDRWGCSETVSTTVDVRGDSLFGMVGKPDGLCAGDGMTAQRINVSALIHGGYEEKNYEWSARKLHHGHEPVIVDPYQKTIEVDVYGQTEFTVYVFDERLQKSLIIVDTLFMNPVKPVTIDIRYDEASAKQAEIGFCASMPITFLADYTNAGNNPRLYWEVNGSRVKNQNGTTLVWPNVNLAHNVRAVLYSDEICPDKEIAYSNEIAVKSEFYQLTGLDIENDPNGDIKYNTDSAGLTFKLYNPGENPSIKVYRNGLLYDAFTYTGTETSFIYKVKTINYWDKYQAVFRNETGNCLLMNDVATISVRPNFKTTEAINALYIESDLGGDTICVDDNTIYAFRIKGMSQFDMNATVIWMVNDKEWGRYNFPEGAVYRLPEPDKHPNAIEINNVLRTNQLETFDDGFPFYLNKDRFPKSHVDFSAGDSLWAIIVGKSDFNGEEYFIDTLPVMKPKFIQASQATLDLICEEGSLSICEGESLHFSASSTNAGKPQYTWYLNNEIVAEDAISYHLQKPKNNDTLKVVLSSTFLCANNLPMTSPLQIVQVNEIPQLIMPEDTIICAGTDVLLAVQSNASQFEWEADSDLSSLNIKQPLATPLDDFNVYRLKVVSDHGCENSDSVTVGVAPRIEVKVEAAATDTLICRGTPVRISANQIEGGNLPKLTWFKNGYSILEPSITFTATNLQDGDEYYCQMISDVRSCLPTTVRSNVLKFKVNRPFTTDISVEKTILCGVDSVMLIADGGRRFKWTSSDPLVNGSTEDALYVKPSVTTKYYLFADDGEVCTSKDSVEIKVDVYTPVANRIDLLNRTKPEFCEFTDNTFDFRSVPTNGGLDPVYNWYLNNQIQATWVTADISHGFNDQDSIRCEIFASSDIESCASKFASSQEVKITMLPAPRGEATGDTNLCPGESTLIEANGGHRYEWFPTEGLSSATQAQTTATPDVTTKYIAKIIGENDCFIQDTVFILVYDNPDDLRAEVRPVFDSLCFGDSMTLDVAANYTGDIRWFLNGEERPEKGILKYIPQSGDSIFAILKAEILCLKGDEVTTRLFKPSLFSVSVSIPEQIEMCDAERYRIPVESNANTYLWMPKFAIEDVSAKEAVIFPEARHQRLDYVLRASIGNCFAEDKVEVTIKERPATPQVQDYALCRYDSINISVINPSADMAYLWYLDTTAEVSNFGATYANVGEGLYFVKSLAENGCKSHHFGIVEVRRGLYSEAHYEVESTELKVKESLGVYNMSIGAWSKALWDFGDGATEESNSSYVVHTYSNIGQFLLRLIVESSDGCTDTAQNIVINVKPQLGGVFVPNAFMPSAANPEDQVVKVYGENLESVTLIIYTLTGVQLFESRELNRGWDGTYQGREMPSGNYTYQVFAKKTDGQEIVQSGNVILIR